MQVESCGKAGKTQYYPCKNNLKFLCSHPLLHLQNKQKPLQPRLEGFCISLDPYYSTLSSTFCFF